MKRYFFLGIGGIGMSALARYCLSRGCEVYGYDRVRSHLCEELEAEGCKIIYNDDASQLSILNSQFSILNCQLFTLLLFQKITA